MRQRKIYHLLLLFDETDLREFKAYLANPWFNKKKTAQEFFLHWRKRILENPENREREMSVEEFLQGSGFDRKRMDKLCSQLYALAHAYLAQKEFEQDPKASESMFLSAVERRDQGHRESLRVNERMQAQARTEKEGPDKIRQLLDLTWKHAETVIRSRETRALWQEDFHELHGLLDQYYQLQKLKLVSASANARQIFNQDQRDLSGSFLHQLANSAEDVALQPLARAYYLTIRMLESDAGDAFFRELLVLLGERAVDFAVSEAIELYRYALNFCIREANKGRPDYLRHASALYLQLLENKLILDGGEILPQQFKNIVSLHCRLEMLDWVERFIHDFAPYLPEAQQAPALLYNEAVLAFHRKDYAAAIMQLKEVVRSQVDDVFYGLDARVYLWKSYFEHHDHLSIEEVDEMYRLYDAFRLYIERNEKVSSIHKQYYRNFIREFKRFIEILRSEPVVLKSLAQLRADVAGMETVANKGWFMQKIDASLTRLAL